MIFIFGLIFSSATFADQSCSKFLAIDLISHPTDVAALDIYALDVISKGQKPYLGLIVKTHSNELLLAIGAFFGSSHLSILKGLDQKGVRIKSVLWGGELLVSHVDSKLILHSANETSGSLHLLNLRQEGRLYNDPFPDLTFLRGVTYSPSNIKWLKAFAGAKGLVFSPRFTAIKYSEDNRYILPQLDVGSNFRHDFNNELNSVILGLAVLSRHQTPSVSSEDLRVRLEKLVLYTKYYLYLDDSFMDEKTIKYLSEYIEKMENLLIEDPVQWDLTHEEWNDLQVSTFKVIKLVFKEKDKTFLHQFRRK